MNRMASGDDRAPLLEGLIAPVRRHGLGAFPVAMTIVLGVAGLLSGAAITLPIWQWVLIAAGTYLIVLLFFVFSSPRYKFWLFSLIYRRRLRRDPVDRPYRMNLQGTHAGAPVLQVAAGRRVDRAYESGLRALLDAKNPVAIIASPPRDVS